MPNQFFGDPGGFFEPIHEKIEARHQEEEGRKKEKRTQLFDMANNPELSDDVRNWASQEHLRMLNPEIAKKVKQHTPVMRGLAGLFGFKRGQESPEATQKKDGGSYTTASTPGGGQTHTITPPGGASETGGPVGPPSKIYDTPAANERALEVYRQKALIDQQRQIAVAGAKPPVVANKKQVQYASPDGKEVVSLWQDPKTLQVFTAQGEPAEVPEGYKPYKAEAAGVSRREYFIDPDDAEQRPHLVYVDPRHPEKRIDAETLEPVKAGWKPFNMEEHVAKVRGSQYGTGVFNTLRESIKAQHPELSEAEVEAQAGYLTEEKFRREVENIGATRFNERAMVQGGKIVATPMYSGVTPRPLTEPPAAPAGPPGAAAPPPGPGAVPALPGENLPVAPPVAAPPKPAAAKPATPPRAAAPAAGSSASGRVLGIPPAQYRTQLNDFRGVRAADTALFGDPNSKVPGLYDYADVMRDREGAAKVGAALRLTMDGLEQATSGGHAGISGEGGSLNIGGVGTWLGNQFGIPQKVASQQQRMLREAVESLDPRQREAYNATIAAMESIVGLRAVTRAGSSQATVRALQEALPIMGVNVADEAQFRDKAKRLAVEIAAGVRGIPKEILDPETQREYEQILALPTRLQQGGAPAPGPVAVPKAAAPVPPPPKVGDVVDGFRYKGGDPAKQESWEASAKKTGTK